MIVVAILGIFEIPFPHVEKMIMISVFSLGTSIALAKKIPTIVGIFFVGTFAAFHGHAHGTEMPFIVNP